MGWHSDNIDENATIEEIANAQWYLPSPYLQIMPIEIKNVN